MSIAGFALGQELAVKIVGLSKYQNKGFNLDDNICSELQAGRAGSAADGWKLFLI